MTSLNSISAPEVEAWLKALRDAFPGDPHPAWVALDDALGDFRDHMATGTPLGQPVQGPHHEEQG